jgi:hypothetical protein
MIDFKWDKWQEKVLKTSGNLAICAGRQVGKSTIISKDAGDYAIKNKKKVIMIIASTERQALLLFEKVLSYIHQENKNIIMVGANRPTKHELKLKNGTKIYCLPTGDSGYGIRGYTIDRLYADEAHFIKEEVWAAVSPMLATTGGDIVLLSTPFGCEGYFYRCFHDKKFTSIHVDTKEVAESRNEPQRTNMLNFLKDEKERMTKLQYQQEYLGLFVGGIQRFFEDELINAICKIEKHHPKGDKFLGIDVARMGGDETVLTSLDRINRTHLYQFDLDIPEPQRLTDTTRLIIHKDQSINHKKIYIDDGGLGVGVFDALLENPQTKRKTVAINNAHRVIDKEKGKKTERRKPLMKEMLYTNLKNLMENNKILLFDDPRVRQSLRSIQMDYGDGKLKIYGNYSHIVEAIIRAAWCMKDKTLNIRAFC